MITLKALTISVCCLFSSASVIIGQTEGECESEGVNMMIESPPDHSKSMNCFHPLSGRVYRQPAHGVLF